MLIKATTLNGYALRGLDGDIGKVKEFFFDDQHWAIRYLVADTGNWLTGRQVLISPYALIAVTAQGRHITVRLTTKAIEESPSLDSDKPVSRQFEEAYHGYYGWPMYWGGAYMWGAYPYPSMSAPDTDGVHDGADANAPVAGEKAWDPQLRSTRDVTGHHIQASDGELGHVEDFIIDDQTWAIRYLLIDTRNWWPGKHVLISPQWIDRVSWGDSKVFVNLPRETIRQSPEYTDEALPTRHDEAALYQHYKRPGYWVDDPAVKQHAR